MGGGRLGLNYTLINMCVPKGERYGSFLGIMWVK